MRWIDSTTLSYARLPRGYYLAISPGLFNPALWYAGPYKRRLQAWLAAAWYVGVTNAEGEAIIMRKDEAETKPQKGSRRAVLTGRHWYAEEADGEWYVMEDSNTHIATLGCDDGTEARLLAAAPDLLAALKREHVRVLRAGLSRFHLDGLPGDCPTCALIARASEVR